MLRIILFFLLCSSLVYAQTTKPLIATDNSTQTCNTTRMIFAPGAISCSGSVATITTSGSGSGISTITDGTHTVSSATQLTVTGGTVGGTTPNATLTVTGGTGTNYWNLDVGNVGINTTYNVGIGTIAAGNALTVAGTVVGTTFSGAGTSLTGTAASLSIGGNSATSTALASSPTNCSSGQAPQGINASGTAQNCTTYSQQTFGTLTNTDWCNTNGTSISCTQAIPVTAFSGDGLVLGNSSSTGAVTAATKAQTQNTVLGAATSTTLAALAVPSCSGASNALSWTSGTGFGCNTISGSSQWTTTNTNDVYLPNNGNVGIGTTQTTTAALTVMNGNVGIGTWIPAQLLDVNGTIRSIGTSPHIFGSDNANSISNSASSSGDLTFNTNSLERMRIGNGGGVGIGTTKTTTAALTVMNGNVGIGTWIPGGSLVVMGGNVGIGTTTPAATFDANKATSMVIPVAAGNAPTALGSIGFDSTQLRYTSGGNQATTGYFPRVLYVSNATNTASNTLTCATITTTETAFGSAYSVPANFMIQNKVLRITAMFDMVGSATATTQQIHLRWGGVSGTAILTYGAIALNNASEKGVGGTWLVQGTAGAGASVNVEVGGSARSGGNYLVVNTTQSPVAVTTNAQESLVFTDVCGGNTAGNTMTLRQFIIEELN